MKFRTIFLVLLVLSIWIPAGAARAGDASAVGYTVDIGMLGAPLDPTQGAGAADDAVTTSILQDVSLSNTISGSRAAANGGGASSGNIDVAVGVIDAGAHVTLTGAFSASHGDTTGAEVTSRSAASAIWDDSATLEVGPSFPADHPVKWTGELALHGSFSANYSSDGFAFERSNASLSLVTDPTTTTTPPPPVGAYWSVFSDERGTATQDYPPPPTVTFQMTIMPGRPFNVEYGMTVQLDTDLFSPLAGSSSLFVSADFGNTLSWARTTSMVDGVTGEPLSDWSITSQSGFNYGPEPTGACALLLIGALGVRRPRRIHLERSH
jgi:hypothetical protein